MSEGSSRLNFPKNSKSEEASSARNTSAAKNTSSAKEKAPVISLASTLPSAAFFATFLRQGFYFSIFLFILFIILVIIHFTINPVFDFTSSFSMETTPTLEKGQEFTAFTSAPAVVDMSANFASPPSCSLTLSVDLQQQGDQKSTTIPRVFLYRAKEAIPLPHSIPSSTEMSDYLKSTYPDSNLILQMDPIKNDLQVSAITKDTAGSNTILVETAPPIENLPIRTPVRITIVYTEKMMEIYMNGKMQLTHPFTQPPITVATDFQAPSAQVGTSLKIGNLRVQSQPLPSSAIRNQGTPAQPSFFT